jgi:hypothetical protein
MSIADLLGRAKSSIDAGENYLHQAAEDIAAATEQGATQRKIAETVGKSAAWVNQLLRWRQAGYQDTAFGPQSKVKRDRVQATEQKTRRKPATDNEQARAQTARARADKAKADAAKAKADAAKAKADAAKANADARKADANARKARDEWFTGMMRGRPNPKKKVHSGPRERLVKSLGILGSDQAGERDAAALMVEKLRKILDMSWDELIVEVD